MSTEQKFYLIDTTSSDAQEKIKKIIMKEPIVNNTSKMKLTNIPIRVLDDNNIEKLVFLKMPEVRVPFGVSEFEGPTRKKFNMLTSFHELDTSEEQNNSLTFFRLFDERMVELACQNKEWVGRGDADPEAVVKAFHQPIIKKSKHKNEDGTDKYPPQVNIKLPTYQDGNFRTKVFVDKTTKLPPPPESIVNNSRCSCVVNVSSMYLVGGKFGVTVEGEQIKTTAVKQRVMDTCLLSDDEDEVGAE
jgi:hypothetical protein